MVTDHIGSKSYTTKVFGRVSPCRRSGSKEALLRGVKEAVVPGLCTDISDNVMSVMDILAEYNRNCHYYCFGHEREQCEGILKYILVC